MNIRRIEYASVSHRGNIKEINQDNIFTRVSEQNSKVIGLFMVADGMGGYENGEKASEIMVEVIEQWWESMTSLLFKEQGSEKLTILSQSLDKAMEKANFRIIEYGNDSGIKLGTTASIMLLIDNIYMIKHIGDSRIYRINNKIEKLTEDHSWVAREVKLGKLTEEEAEKHPRRHVLTRCLGMTSEIDLFTRTGNINLGDDFLLCSDGLYKLLDKKELRKLINEASELNTIVNSLLKNVMDRGERDNISCILISVEHGEDLRVTKKEKKMGLLRWIKKLF